MYPEVDSVPWYWRSLDFEQLTRDYPPPPDYFRTTFRMSRDETGGGNVEARGRQMDRWRQYGKGSASHLDRIQCAGPDRSGASLG